MATIRVLIVEDSLTVRARLREVLNTDPGIEVIGEAEDGKRAIDLCTRLRPDVVTLDMVLPCLSGLAVTEYLMAYCPTPILIISASFNRGELFKTYDALAAGAVEVLEKPRGDALDEGWERRVIDTVKLVARIKVITHPRQRLGALGRPPAAAPAPASQVSSNGGPRRLVAIGASTGGPGAVLEILRGLPSDYPLPILVVVHIGEPFGSAFADWLDAQSPLGARYARDGEPLPRPGEPKVLLAPPERHLVLRDGRLRLTTDAARHSCRPSVDVLFESLEREVGSQAIACLLTGMGKDGAHGLLAIRRAGGVTLAQDEATSVVFGMPREAIDLGAAGSVLPVDHIAPTLVALAGSTHLPGGAREADRPHRR